MINCSNYNQIFTCNPEEAKVTLESQLSDESVSFSNVDSFPNSNGLYFVFMGSDVVYIGKADKQNIKNRCKQYVNNSSGGTLRKKIECTRLCSSSDAISYICNSFAARFLEIDDVEKIPVLEEVAIWAFQLKLNVIKPSIFSYEKLVL